MLTLANTDTRMYTTFGITVNPGINKLNITQEQQEKYLAHPSVQRRIKDGLFIVLNKDPLPPYLQKQLGKSFSIDGKVQAKVDPSKKKEAVEGKTDGYVDLLSEEDLEEGSDQGEYKSLNHKDMRKLVDNCDSISVLKEILADDDRKTTQMYVKSRIEYLENQNKK